MSNAISILRDSAQVKGPQAHTGGPGVSPDPPFCLGWGGAGTATVREPSPAYGTERHLLEADLSHIWEGQRFPRKALVTTDGEALRVIFRGRPGAGPGPDFRGAIIAAPGRLLSGDVELHVRTSDFRRHGHHLDAAYSSVVLHVVFFHDESGETALPGGSTAPVLALGGPHTARWLERPARWGEPCRSAVERMSADGVGAALDRLGAMRFRRKTAAWRKRLAAGERIEDALWSGLLEALAYGGERVAFRRLASELPWSSLRDVILATDDTDELRCDADPVEESDGSRIGADQGGRVWPQIGADFSQITAMRAARTLSDVYSRLGVSPARRSRPGNGPERRLRGAAELAARFAGPGLSASLIGPLAEPEAAANALIEALTVPRLIGRARAIEIAGNAVLPLAAALCDEPAASRIEEVFAGLPMPSRYGSVKHLHAVTRDAMKVAMRRQQGMLYLLHQYCTQGGCGKCPLS
ncbi:MAG: DUF2851 family protein [Burkholderiales bacterium]